MPFSNASDAIDHSASIEGSTAPFKQTVWSAWAVAILALFVYTAGNGSALFWDRDEPRYAGTARTMLATGDFIVPYFQAEFRYQKPPLTYWLVAASFQVFGESEWSARLVSALCVAAGCGFIAWVGNRQLGSPVGTYAGIILAFCPLTFLMGKLCIPDGPQFITACVAFGCLWMLRSHEGESTGRSTWPATAFWIAVAFSILAKGPIVAGMLIATLLVHRLLTGLPVLDWNVRAVWGLAVAFGIAAPWVVAIYVTAGLGFFSESLGHQLAGRLTQSFDARFWPPGFYIATTMVTFMPWTPMLLAAIHQRPLREWRRGHAAFLASWIIGPLVLIELFQSKQPHYYLPAVPPLALLTSAWICDLIRKRGSIPNNVHGITPLYGPLVMPLLLFALAVVAVFSLPEAVATLVVGAFVASLGSIGWLVYARHRPRAGFHWLSAGSVACLLAVAVGLMPSLSNRRTVAGLAARLAALHDLHPGDVVLWHLGEPSMIYYGARDLPDLAQPGELLSFVRFRDRSTYLPCTQPMADSLSTLLPNRVRILSETTEIIKLRPEQILLVEIAGYRSDDSSAEPLPSSDPLQPLESAARPTSSQR